MSEPEVWESVLLVVFPSIDQLIIVKMLCRVVVVRIRELNRNKKAK